MERDIRGRFTSFWSAAKRIIKSAIKWYVYRVLSIAVGVIILIGVSVSHGQEVKFVERVIAQTVYVESSTLPPILEKIAKCESGNSHIDKNGQVLINKTQDMGRYQIHIPLWGKRAKEMGLDLSNEKDNETFAIWLFMNYGSAPWSASANCWSK